MEKTSTFDWERFKKYVDNYPTDSLVMLSNKTIILDMLYGLGISLDPDEYCFSTGFKKFQILLRDELLTHDVNGQDSE